MLHAFRMKFSYPETNHLHFWDYWSGKVCQHTCMSISWKSFLWKDLKAFLFLFPRRLRLIWNKFPVQEPFLPVHTDPTYHLCLPQMLVSVPLFYDGKRQSFLFCDDKCRKYLFTMNQNYQGVVIQSCATSHYAHVTTCRS